MKIKFFCPRWGQEQTNFETFCNKVKHAEYDGIEMSLPIDADERSAIVETMSAFNLELIAQHWETFTADFELHKTEYRTRLENLAGVNPVFINSQTGKDFFSYEQNVALIGIANEVAKERGIKIIHETHRGKFSFAAHITADYLKKNADLRLTLDMSHWCAVAESLLEDQPDAVDLAISRTDHIHSRVGFAEGPQIPDPRAAEWELTLAKHVAVWQRVLDCRKMDGLDSFTITSEFGPAPYMTLLPHTKQPIADQWEINVFMKDHLKQLLK
ncbi:MAG: sugar phosphate isomerase/epimerase [Ferruginibacter sp.]